MDFPAPPARRRAVAYCRVSTTDQSESYETQYAFYSLWIAQDPGLVFAGIYSDLGKSGTGFARRDGFRRMLQDAEAHRFDLIFVKSVSRFARNIADCQRCVDRLTELGVTVVFEREAIRTDDPASRLSLALLGAVSQDESHSISQNIAMGYHERFSRGVYNLGNNRVLGYSCTKDGCLVPNGEAPAVLQIFTRFAAGESVSAIAAGLNAMGLKTLRGKPFSAPAVRYILGNETYAGDKHLQKAPPADYLTHRPDPSAAAPDYYLTNDHEAIVPRELWNRVRDRLAAREASRRAGILGDVHHPLYGKVVCGRCGSLFRRRTFTRRNGLRYHAWNCSDRQKGKAGSGCTCPGIREDELLRSIAESLGRQSFDARAFKAEVARVTVTDGGIRVERNPSDT